MSRTKAHGNTCPNGKKFIKLVLIYIASAIAAAAVGASRNGAISFLAQSGEVGRAARAGEPGLQSSRASADCVYRNTVAAIVLGDGCSNAMVSNMVFR